MKGKKSRGFLESGYIYAPYIPLQVTPTILGEDEQGIVTTDLDEMMDTFGEKTFSEKNAQHFSPRKAIRTRYAKKMIKPEHYGKVVVGELK